MLSHLKIDQLRTNKFAGQSCRKVMMTGEKHLTRVVDDRILLTFYNVWGDTLHNWVGWGKVRGEYFLHCVTIWQISQLGSSQRGNLENAQVSPISKGGHRAVLKLMYKVCSSQGWVWCHVGALLLIWRSGWGYYRETLPRSDRRALYTLYSEQTAKAMLKVVGLGWLPLLPSL